MIKPLFITLLSVTIMIFTSLPAVSEMKALGDTDLKNSTAQEGICYVKLPDSCNTSKELNDTMTALKPDSVDASPVSNNPSAAPLNIAATKSMYVATSASAVVIATEQPNPAEAIIKTAPGPTLPTYPVTPSITLPGTTELSIQDYSSIPLWNGIDTTPDLSNTQLSTTVTMEASPEIINSIAPTLTVNQGTSHIVPAPNETISIIPASQPAPILTLQPTIPTSHLSIQGVEIAPH